MTSWGRWDARQYVMSVSPGHKQSNLLLALWWSFELSRPRARIPLLIRLHAHEIKAEQQSWITYHIMDCNFYLLHLPIIYSYPPIAHVGLVSSTSKKNNSDELHCSRRGHHHYSVYGSENIYRCYRKQKVVWISSPHNIWQSMLAAIPQYIHFNRQHGLCEHGDEEDDKESDNGRRKRIMERAWHHFLSYYTLYTEWMFDLDCKSPWQIQSRKERAV